MDSGFETVTYMLQGAFTHQDFAGHKGTIRTGDLQVWISNTQKIPLFGKQLQSYGFILVLMFCVCFLLFVLQWMTAGRGIIHSEMPAGEGVQRGLQLWINLPSKDKMYGHPNSYSFCFSLICIGLL